MEVEASPDRGRGGVGGGDAQVGGKGSQGGRGVFDHVDLAACGGLRITVDFNLEDPNEEGEQACRITLIWQPAEGFVCVWL